MRVTQDFLLGVFFVAVGAIAGLGALSYPIGSASRMGPGFFPIIIAGLLTLVGIAVLLRGHRTGSLPIEPTIWLPVLVVPAVIVLFGLVLDGLGLPLAVFLLLVGTAAASVTFRLDIRAALGAVAVSAICSALFVKLLGLPIPLAGSWLPFAG